MTVALTLHNVQHAALLMKALPADVMFRAIVSIAQAMAAKEVGNLRADVLKDMQQLIRDERRRRDDDLLVFGGE